MLCPDLSRARLELVGTLLPSLATWFFASRSHRDNPVYDAEGNNRAAAYNDKVILGSVRH
jgi:hypothetical protein